MGEWLAGTKIRQHLSVTPSQKREREREMADWPQCTETKRSVCTCAHIYTHFGTNIHAFINGCPLPKKFVLYSSGRDPFFMS